MLGFTCMETKERTKMYNQVTSIVYQVSGTKDSPLTEDQLSAQYEHFENSEIVASVDVLTDLDKNRAKFFLVFARPVSFREVADLA